MIDYRTTVGLGVRRQRTKIDTRLDDRRQRLARAPSVEGSSTLPDADPRHDLRVRPASAHGRLRGRMATAPCSIS